MTGLGTALSERIAPKADAATRDPVSWIESKLGERPWSKQSEIAESVLEHRYTAVPSAHGIGKSYLAARLVSWWIDSHPIGEAFAVTTAPTGPQVEAVIWREINRAHQKGQLAGRITGGAVPAWKVGSEMVAYGRKPQDLIDPEQAAAAFQGIHARYVLVVLDEAAGISPWLWDAVDSLVTNENGRVLAIGNPTDPTSSFAKVCEPGSGWNVLPVSVFDTPIFTGERASRDLLELLPSEQWVEERKRRWGEGTPLYVAKVLGQFPEEAEDTLITPALVRDAWDLELQSDGLGTIGVDVARAGSDETVAYIHRGGVVRQIHRARGQDTMRTSGAVAKLLRADGNTTAVVDIIGIGAGVYDRLREQGLSVTEYQASERPRQPERFANRRAESYWRLRELLQRGEIDLDPADEELASQLLSIRWFTNSRGLTQIEPKEEMRKRGLPSPDRADAVAMAVGAPAIALAVSVPLETNGPQGPFVSSDINFLEVQW
jgi:hypothetical protein